MSASRSGVTKMRGWRGSGWCWSRLAQIVSSRVDRPITSSAVPGSLVAEDSAREAISVRARQQQHARGVLVQTMHQLGLVLIAEHQRLGQPVHMPVALPAAALRRQARRLVQRDDMFVAPQDAVLDHLGIRLRHAAARLRGWRLALRQGRDADFLPGLKPGIGLHPPAIDAQLPGAAHLFHRALRQFRKPLLQPAVDALVAIIDADLNCLNAAHAKIPRPKAKPAKTAASENRTEAST